MKLFQKILFVVIVGFIGVSSGVNGVHGQNIIEILNNFAKESWKSQLTCEQGGRIVDATQGSQDPLTIEQRLVNAFNGADWGVKINGEETKINGNLNQSIQDYYSENLLNPIKWTNNLAANDSPRQWMRNLNLREIYRFKKIVEQNDLINNENYGDDDLVKARALCGIFWVVNTNKEKKGARRAFSGMLFPGQSIYSETYSVHTCMHGFRHGNIKDDIAYYFVPYGVMANGTLKDEDPENKDYVVNKGFKVIHIHQGGNNTQNTNIDESKFSQKTTPPGSNTDIDTLYSQNDYAMVTINGKTDNGIKLKDILNGSKNPIKPTTHLPNINGSGDTVAHVEQENVSEFDIGTERLFVIGYSPCVDLDYGITVSTTLTNVAPGDSPRRSIRDDQSTQKPQFIRNRDNEYFSSLATFPGISGGPVLRCRLNNNDGKIKKCAFIGTVFGAERKFAQDDKIEMFANFINKK